MGVTHVSNCRHTSMACHHTVLHRSASGRSYGGRQEESRTDLPDGLFHDVGVVRGGDDSGSIICKIR